MDTRSAYIRRSRKGSRLNKRLAVAAVLGVVGCASLFAFALEETVPPASASPAPALAAAATPTPVVLRTAAPADSAAAPVRRVYPYSIVPGGVHDSQELARVIATDKVVAAHYAGFDPAKFTVKTVDKPRAVYVSYRKGDKVYWTSKKLQLAKGETLLSDGTNEIRTRCGNRISAVRMLPVEANGPSAEELDAFVEQDDGSVQETAFGTDSNPAGHGYQLHTFENGGVVMPVSGSQPRSTSTFGTRGPGFDGFGGGGAGAPPLFLTGNVDKDVPATNGGGGSGSGSGSSGSSGPGAGTGSGSGSAPAPGTPGTPTETVVTPPTEVTGGDKPAATTPSDSAPPSAPPGKPDQPSGDPAPTPSTPTTPSTPSTPSTPTIPDTLTPPTTDVPGKPGTPGTTPTKPTDVPEPGTPWLAAAGVMALLAARRSKKRG